MVELQKQYRVLFENMAQGAFYQSEDGSLIDVNPAALAMFGLSRDQFTGRTSYDPAWRVVAEDGADLPPEHHPSMVALRTGQEVRDFIAGVYNPLSKSLVWLSISAIPMFREGEKAPYQVFVTLHDISAQKRMNDILLSRLHLMQFAAEHSLEELLVETLDEVERLTGSMIGFYHFYNPDNQCVTLKEWSTRTSTRFCRAEGKGEHYSMEQAGVWVDCIREGKPVVHNDYASLPHRCGLPDGHAALTRELVVPVKRNNRIVAILGVGNKPYEYNEADVNAVSFFADLAWDIAEGKRSELLRQQALRQYEVLTSTSMDGYWVVDGDGRIISANDTICRVYGYSREELLTKSLHDFDALENPQQMRAHIARIKSGGYDRFETRHYRKDGSVIDVEVSTAFITESGIFLAFTRDISERRQNESALRNSENRYRAIVNSQTEFIDRYLPGGTLTFVNEALCSYVGMQSSELLGKSFYSFVHPDDLDGLLKSIEALNLQHPSCTVENRVSLGDGTVRWHQWTHTAVFNTSGNIQEYQSVGRDITERKQTEEALRESELKFRTLFSTIQDAIFLTVAEDGRIVECNEKLSGYSREELIGSSSEELGLWADLDERHRVVELVRERGSVNDFEAIFRRKDGTLFSGSISTNAFPLAGKTYLLSVVRDISDRKQAEEERFKLEQQLLHTQKLESLGVLAGGIAHDFNNILTAIIGNADLALMRINRESPAVENLRRIEKAASQAADLARQMLAYSGKGKFVVEHLDLNLLLEEMLHMLEVSISKKAVLRFNLTRPLPTVEADATQMRQIVMNLVINASEAIGDKSGVIAVSTGCMDCDESYLKDVWLDENLERGLYVYLEISDSGCGMDRETMARLFDPFFTTKFTGRGLGMAAVLGIVRGHRGAIKLYSEPGRGTTFKILLPSSGRPSEIFNGEAEVDNWRGSGTVLLVDDEETVRGIGAEMLRELGFETITANDGRQALEVFKSTPGISFVILDLTMPHMDGEQCFRELRRLDADVRVIMSSGYNEYEVSQKFAGRRLAGFIQKPYKLSTLRTVIRGMEGE